MGQHLAEARHRQGHQLVLAAAAQIAHRAVDAAAGGGDLQVGLAADAPLVFVLTGAAEDRVGVGIDQARDHGAAAGIDDRQPRRRRPVQPQRGAQLGLRTGAHDAAGGHGQGAAVDDAQLGQARAAAGTGPVEGRFVHRAELPDVEHQQIQRPSGRGVVQMQARAHGRPFAQP